MPILNIDPIKEEHVKVQIEVKRRPKPLDQGDRTGLCRRPGLFYVALFIPRQIDDDKRCAAKYGKLWDQYVSKIKYRIIPFLY
jgi:hypothetical protein